MKVEENKETPDLLSFPIRFLCGISQQIRKISPRIRFVCGKTPTSISNRLPNLGDCMRWLKNNHAGVNYSTNSAVNFAGVLYFGIFYKKYISYIQERRE
jgi:hypothetical protein